LVSSRADEDQKAVKEPDVIIPPNHPNPPEKHEVEAAWILARHFNTIVEFLIPIKGYKVKTSDIVLLGLIWEIKSPKGDSKTTVGNQFKAASKQRARHIVFDARRTKLTTNEILIKIKHEKKYRQSIKRVILITKESTVIEIDD
jgi:hypothetical protein